MSKMRIALIGGHGQLGTDLQSCLDGDVSPLGHDEIELTDEQSIRSSLGSLRPQCVINAAAYNQVDQAEREPEIAYAVNALGPRSLALFCEERDIPLMHISSDYVFGLEDKREVPYRETDCPGPLSAYGTSKLAGEYFVRSLCRKHFVVRTCGLYGQAGRRGRGNFVETMLRLAAEGKTLSIVDDQHCTPTATADLAPALSALLQTEAFGLYHATNAGQTTWYHFAREIFRLAGSQVEALPISSVDYGAPAPRPGFSVLDNDKLTGTIGFALRPWQEALARYLNERAG